MFKKILLFTLMCLFLLTNHYVLNAESGVMNNVLAEVGTIEEEDLEVSGYQLVESSHVNFDKPGEYTLQYLNLKSEKYVYRKLVLFNSEDYLSEKNITINTFTLGNQYENEDVVTMCSDKDYAFVIYSNNMLVCFRNGIMLWTKSFDNYDDVILSDVKLSVNGILLYYSVCVESGWDVVLDEYDYNGNLLKSLTLVGEKNDYSDTLMVIGNNIYITGITYSKTNDFEYFYPVEGSNQAFIARIEYYDYVMYDIYGYGNKGENQLLQTIFGANEVYLKVKINEDGPYGIKTYGPESVFLFSLGYEYGLHEYGYNSYDRYDMDGDEVVVSIDGNFGVITSINNNITLKYIGENMELSGRVTTLWPNYSGYQYSGFEVKNEYDDFELVTYFTNGNEKVYKVYKVIDDEFCEVYSGEGTYIKGESNHWEFNETLTEKIRLSASSFSTKSTKTGTLSKRDYYCNGEKLDFTYEKTEGLDYGVYDIVMYAEYNNIDFYIKAKEYVNCLCNIKNDQVYDLNVELIFNGIGYLNNQKISSGHIVNEVGRHILVVYSNDNQKKEFIFEVKSLSQGDAELNKPIYNNGGDYSINKEEQSELTVIEDGVAALEEEEGFNFFLVGLFLLVGIIIGVIISKIKNKNSYYSLIIIGCILAFSSVKINAYTEPDVEVLSKVETKEVVDKALDYSLIEENERFCLIKNGEIIAYINGNKASLTTNGDVVLLSYINNGYLYLRVYDKDNIKEYCAIKNQILGEYYLDIVGDYIYIGLNINEYQDSKISQIAKNKNISNQSIVILKLDLEGNIDKINVLGGTKNDLVLSMNVGDKFIITGVRQRQSGGSFGYSGQSEYSTFIALLDESFNVEKYRIIDVQSHLHKVNSNNEKIVFQQDKQIYLLEKELDFISKYQLESENIIIDSTEYIYEFLDNKLKILNLNTNIIKEIETGFEDIEYIRRLENCYFLKGKESYYLNILNFEKTLFDSIYDPDKEVDYSARSLFDVVSPTVEHRTFFDSQVDGDYFIILTYEIDGFESVKKEGKITVPKLINVIDGRIYPVGYRLVFTGVATINEEIIVNNYELKNIGNYVLKIKNANGKEQIVSFEVSDNQLDFTEQFQKSKNVFNIGSEVIFSFDCRLDYNVEVDKLVIDGSDYFNCLYKKTSKLLEVKFSNYEPGYYNYFINGFYYYLNNNYFYYPINKQIDFLVVDEMLRIELEEIDSSKNDLINLSYNIVDNAYISRMLMVKTTNGSEESIAYYPIGTTQIIVDSQINYNTIEFYYVYDINQDNKYINLFNIKLDEEINDQIKSEFIVQEQDGHINLEVCFKDNIVNKIAEIKVNDVLKYSSEKFDPTRNLIFGFGSCIIGLFVVLIISKIKSKY